jgi:hypothetical protein
MLDGVSFSIENRRSPSKICDFRDGGSGSGCGIGADARGGSIGQVGFAGGKLGVSRVSTSGSWRVSRTGSGRVSRTGSMRGAGADGSGARSVARGSETPAPPNEARAGCSMS